MGDIRKKCNPMVDLPKSNKKILSEIII